VNFWTAFEISTAIKNISSNIGKPRCIEPGRRGEEWNIK
jgi:hypothetical protein